MKGIIDLKNEDEWVVRYRIEEASGVIVYNTIPLSRFNKIMYKNQLYINGEVEFNIIKENNHISYCTCSDKQYNDCEYFVKSGINECMNYENIEVEVAKIISLAPKPNEMFDRETVKNLLIEVKNRFSVIDNDNYNSDLDVIEWFEINYPKK